MYKVFFVDDDGYKLCFKYFDTLLEATNFANQVKNLVIQIVHLNNHAKKKEFRT